MNMDSRGFFNSPVIQKNTPIKRLGLSRKRKSSDSIGNLNANQASSEKSFKLDEKTKGANEPEMNDGAINQVIDYEKELGVLKTKISEKEEKLKTFQHINKNILELEDLIKLWKTGCKNAYLELMQILNDKEPNFTNEDVLNKLGIWETMCKHFEQDGDISLSLDCS